MLQKGFDQYVKYGDESLTGEIANDTAKYDFWKDLLGI
jgi:hypothetical protein